MGTHLPTAEDTSLVAAISTEISMIGSMTAWQARWKWHVSPLCRRQGAGVSPVRHLCHAGHYPALEKDTWFHTRNAISRSFKTGLQLIQSDREYGLPTLTDYIPMWRDRLISM
jgi:hypothetical protein